MKLDSLFDAIDAKPFRPFVIELLNGRKVKVSQPDNIFVLPNRQAVHNIQVFEAGIRRMAMIRPESIAALLYDGRKSRRG